MKKILVIDDDDCTLVLLHSHLQSKGYEVIELHDAINASAIISNNKPDAILLDVSMPDKDGFECLIEYKEKFPDTPIIAISVNKIYLDAMKAMGASGTILKPIFPEVLFATLENLGIKS